LRWSAGHHEAEAPAGKAVLKLAGAGLLSALRGDKKGARRSKHQGIHTAARFLTDLDVTQYDGSGMGEGSPGHITTMPQQPGLEAGEPIGAGRVGWEQLNLMLETPRDPLQERPTLDNLHLLSQRSVPRAPDRQSPWSFLPHFDQCRPLVLRHLSITTPP